MTRSLNIPPGLYWHHGEGKDQEYWSFSSETYTCLEPLFINFGTKFAQIIGPGIQEFVLTREQVQYLISGIEERLGHLIKEFDPLKTELTSTTKSYGGQEYKLFVNLSLNHRLIYALIGFLELLSESVKEDTRIICSDRNHNHRLRNESGD